MIRISSIILMLLLSACTGVPLIQETSTPASPVVPLQRETPTYTAPDTPFMVGQVWSGYYICSRGKVELNLRITEVSSEKTMTELGEAYSLTAVFDFRNQRAAGAFYLKGNFFPENGVTFFDPTTWIRQPVGYKTVGMDGRISTNGQTYSGNVTGAISCQNFTVSLQ